MDSVMDRGRLWMWVMSDMMACVIGLGKSGMLCDFYLGKIYSS